MSQELPLRNLSCCCCSLHIPIECSTCCMCVCMYPQLIMGITGKKRSSVQRGSSSWARLHVLCPPSCIHTWNEMGKRLLDLGCTMDNGLLAKGRVLPKILRVNRVDSPMLLKWIRVPSIIPLETRPHSP